MAGPGTRIKVRMLFPIESQGHIFAEVEDSGWDRGSFGPVDLCADDVRIRMRYKGYGGHGQLTLVIAPQDADQGSLTQIVCLLGGKHPPNTYIERVGNSERAHSPAS